MGNHTVPGRMRFGATIAWVVLCIPALCRFGSRPLQAQTVTAAVTTGTNPFGVAVNPVTDKIYAADNGSSNVVVTDGRTNATTTVAVGARPRAITL